MSIQEEMQAAGQEYACHLEKQAQAERRAALTLEARRHSNAALFAEAVGAALDKLTPPADIETADLADLTEAIRTDAAQETNS